MCVDKFLFIKFLFKNITVEVCFKILVITGCYFVFESFINMKVIKIFLYIYTQRCDLRFKIM